MMMTRKYPIGIQTFSEIIRGGYVYVDKTDLVWQLADYAKYVFLSRPRRFGKSLLTSTLESYFKGERELFEGLKIMELEKKWEQYPVLRFDLSGAKHLPPESVRKELGLLLNPYENIYGRNPEEETPGMRLSGLIDIECTETKIGFISIIFCRIISFFVHLQAILKIKYTNYVRIYVGKTSCGGKEILGAKENGSFGQDSGYGYL